jgi:hypothetical protein
VIHNTSKQRLWIATALFGQRQFFGSLSGNPPETPWKKWRMIKMEGCMFVVGMLAGGFVGVTAMCLFQISGMESRKEEKDAFRNQKRK